MLNVKACSWSQLFCTATHTHTKEEEATENARQKTDTPEKNYIERLSSGKVYAVHLFVLVSSVKIFAYHNRKIVQKKYQRDRKKRTIHRKKKKQNYNSRTNFYIICCVHTAKVSTKQDVWKLYFCRCYEYAALSIAFPICRCSHRHHLLRSFDISTRIDLFESLPFSQQFHISVILFFYHYCWHTWVYIFPHKYQK